MAGNTNQKDGSGPTMRREYQPENSPSQALEDLASKARGGSGQCTPPYESDTQGRSSERYRKTLNNWVNRLFPGL
jgi:hypothetical protein